MEERQSSKSLIMPHLTEEFCTWLLEVAKQRQIEIPEHCTNNAINMIISIANGCYHLIDINDSDEPCSTFYTVTEDGDWLSAMTDELDETITQTIIKTAIMTGLVEENYVDDDGDINNIWDSDDHSLAFRKIYYALEKPTRPDFIIGREGFLKMLNQLTDKEYEINYTHPISDKIPTGFISPTRKDLTDLMEKKSYKFEQDDNRTKHIVYTFSNSSEISDSFSYGTCFKPFFKLTDSIAKSMKDE